MGLAFAPILLDAGIDPADVLVIRHAYVQLDEDSGLPSLGPHSTDAEILRYTQVQSVNPRSFPASPPSLWIAFMPEGGDRARLWSVLENHGEISNDGTRRTFDLVKTDHLSDLRGRLVIGWKSPRIWRVSGSAAARYPVLEIADVAPERFPGFENVLLDYAKLQAVMSEHRYAAWRTALSSVAGIYLITDVNTGRHYVGKADGAERITQRWNAYATSGHGGNAELRLLDPAGFRFSLLQVFDPSTPSGSIDAAESHFKNALATRAHGLNRN